VLCLSGFCEFHVFGHKILPVQEDVFTIPTQVTTGRPCYDISRGLRINHQQTIATFFSKVFPNPVQVKLSQNDRFDNSTIFSKVSSASVAVSQGDGQSKLMISFKRTVRIPEDKKNHHLPPDLETFPIFDIRPFSEALPPSVVAQGGLFLSMYRK
jgi:hypothetical protein